jgi:hypothetical protein
MSEIITDDALLSELLAGTRPHGEYDEALHKFVDAQEKAIKISLDAGTFQGRKPNSVKTGFTNALNRTTAKKADGSNRGEPLPEGVVIVVALKNDNVYLIRKDMVGPAAASASAPAASE